MVLVPACRSEQGPIGRRNGAGPASRAGTDELHAGSVDRGPGPMPQGSSGRNPDQGALVDGRQLQGSAGDPACRKAWQKAVPTLAEAARSEDVNVRTGALAMLSMLGPEAGQALEPLRALARGTQDPAVCAGAESAIESIRASTH